MDDRGTLTFAEVQRRSNALAREFAADGIGEGDGVAIMCRNHRGFIEATVACSKLGASALYLNTAFAAPQIADVLEREQAVAVDLRRGVRRARGAGARKGANATSDGVMRSIPRAPAADGRRRAVDELIAAGDERDLSPPAEKGRVVILTSGTTGTPKGAARKQPDSLEPAAALFSKIPLRARRDDGDRGADVPLLGLRPLHARLPLVLDARAATPLRPRGDAARIAQSRASTLAVVPVMLQRILDLGPETIGRYDPSALRVVALSGSALPGELATRAMDEFGEILYNLYGSTEVAWATIATPEDLRAAPGTAGRPPIGTVVKLFDEEGRRSPRASAGGSSSATR